MAPAIGSRVTDPRPFLAKDPDAIARELVRQRNALAAECRQRGKRVRTKPLGPEGNVVGEEVTVPPKPAATVAQRKEPEQRKSLSIQVLVRDVSVAAHYAHVGVAECLQKAGQPALFGNDVAIEEDDDLAARARRAYILLLVVSARIGSKDREVSRSSIGSSHLRHCVFNHPMLNFASIVK